MEYVLVTPARNEVAYIEAALRSVVTQSRLPKRWVIVSDGSSDGTDEVVLRYMTGREWIELLHLPAGEERSFSSKAQVFNAGVERLRELEYDIVGNLDADISFEPRYFEYLLDQFAANRRLGVAGTHYVEGEFHSYRDSYISPNHVNGGCQLFRKECFAEIGGYVPIVGGGIDWVAATTARMKGWETRSFGDMVFYHHRKIGTAGTNELVSQFRYGRKDYFLGGHPLWELVRGLYQMGQRPYVVGGFLVLAGYAWSAITRQKRSVSKELMEFHRAEQMRRLAELMRRRFALHR